VQTLYRINQDALLQSARVLDGLFYEGVVVTEADADRAFYEAVAGRLTESSGIHFTNAQGKQAVHLVVEAYREIGIPVASIVDLDILRDSSEFRTLLESHGADKEVVSELLNARLRLAEKVTPEPVARQFEAVMGNIASLVEGMRDLDEDDEKRLRILRNGLERIRREGDPWAKVKLEGLSAFENLRDEAAELLRRLGVLGIFPVPGGELESWFPAYNLPKEKRSFIAKALPIVRGAEPNTCDEPWCFVSTILKYLARGRD
jgi:hypothetical protein